MSISSSSRQHCIPDSDANGLGPLRKPSSRFLFPVLFNPPNTSTVDQRDDRVSVTVFHSTLPVTALRTSSRSFVTSLSGRFVIYSYPNATPFQQTCVVSRVPSRLCLHTRLFPFDDNHELTGLHTNPDVSCA